MFPLAGFWSKDELLVGAWEREAVALLSSSWRSPSMTAFYMTRCVLLTFFGEYRGEATRTSRRRVMTGPLVGLAVPRCVVGFLGAPAARRASFGDWVYFEHPHEARLHLLGGRSSAPSRPPPGSWSAIRCTGNAGTRDPLDGVPSRVERCSSTATTSTTSTGAASSYPIRDRASAGVYWFNQHVLDGVVNGAAWVTRGLATFVSWIDRTVHRRRRERASAA